MSTTVKLNFIKVTKPRAFVVHVQLVREPVNAFHAEFWKEYAAVFDNMREWYGDVRAVVLSSSLPKVFCAGIDFEDLLDLKNSSSSDPARTAMVLRRHVLSFQAAISSPERCPVPVIAAVHGIAYGLAVDLVAACDIRYAASDTRFSIKEVDVGLAPDIGTLARLRHISSNASLGAEFAYTARTFSAEEALSLGVVSRVVEGGMDEVVRETLSLAEEVARKSPVAVTGTKHLLMHARNHSVGENLEYTATWNAAMLQTEDILKAVRSARSKSHKDVNFEPLPTDIAPLVSRSNVKPKL
ncbi:ClpP/crotonase-like domain-containing protein [Pisolithus sp. B1]|nr:ClpP/crotonase-like domain-containing protein [Pisolithus sp. B1]